MLDPDTARWLTSTAGLAAIAGAVAELDAVDGQQARRDAELAVASRLRAAHPEPGRAPAIMDAALARRRARARWPDADRLVLTRTALEQASDPAVAAWRAARFAGADAWDLCAGVGGDALAIATVAGSLVAVDHDEAHLVLLAHNAETRGLEIRTQVADALEVRPPASATLHADPARRRPDGSRVRRLADHRPPVPALLARHAGARGMAVVLSPGVDLLELDAAVRAAGAPTPDRSGVHPGTAGRSGPRSAAGDGGVSSSVEVEFVAVGRQLTEAVLWTGQLARPGHAATATILDADPPGTRQPPVAHTRSRPDPADQPGTRQPPVAHTRSRPDPADPPPAPGPLGTYLVEPAPVAVRARLHHSIAREIGARRIAQVRALLTADDPPPPSPWYTVRPVLARLPARPKAVRRWLAAREAPPLELAAHGLRIDPDRWWRELGHPPRGPAGWRIDLVRVDDGAVAVITDAGG